MKKRSKKHARKNRGHTISRRAFGAGVLGGAGLAAISKAERSGLAAHVSIKEAAYYDKLGREGGEGE